MRKFLIASCVILLCQQTFGQNATLEEKRSNALNSTVIGKAIDSVSLAGVSGATVQILQPQTNSADDIIIALTTCSNDGSFFIDKLPAGTFIIQIIAQGYWPFETTFDLGEKKEIKNFGLIKLTLQKDILDTVAVSGNKPVLQMALDKKIYNAEKDLAAVGGTALDVLKNIPLIQVDIEGNVRLRNASPQILVNGRPSTLLPDQIPGSQLASIEIITNPSAKFDANSGSGGIINIVLKKNRKEGYNGNLRLGIDSRGKSNGGIDLNYQHKKINIFGSANVNGFKGITTTRSTRSELLNGVTIFTKQKNKPINEGVYSYLRGGVDFLIDTLNTITFAANYFRANYDARDQIDIQTDSNSNGLMYRKVAERDLSVDAVFSNKGGSIGYKRLFAGAEKEFTTDFNYNRNTYTNTSEYLSRLYAIDGSQKPYPTGERATGGSSTDVYVFQSDFSNNLTASKKIETGLRIDVRRYQSWNLNFLQVQPAGTYALIPSLSVNYNYHEDVLAGYLNYENKFKSFGYALGVRVESSNYSGDVLTKNQSFSNKYPFSLFPSVFLTEKINETMDVQLSYSRKIYRPGFFQLAPFVDYSDSLNLFTGNPSLKPDFTNVTELALSKAFNQRHSLISTIYFNYTDNIITRYQYKAANTNPTIPDSVLFNSFVNADKNITTGIEITSRNQLVKWWNCLTHLNLYNVALKAGDIPGTYDNSRTSWYVKMNNHFTLPNDFIVQLNADYQSSTILPPTTKNNAGRLGNTQFNAQGIIQPTYGFDVSLRKLFLKNNAASVTLQWNDIFRTRSYNLLSNSDLFLQEVYRLRDPQLLRLTLSWRFGSLDNNIFQRRSGKAERETLNSINSGLGQ